MKPAPEMLRREDASEGRARTRRSGVAFASEATLATHCGRGQLGSRARQCGPRDGSPETLGRARKNYGRGGAMIVSLCHSECGKWKAF